MENKRGEILVENVIFIVLNIIFISILIFFLFKQSSGAALLEQTYSKQIALMVDSAKPAMEIKLNMEKARKIAEKNKIDFNEAVSITGNVVNVKLSQKTGYEYSFFNNVKVEAFPETNEQNEYTGMYIFTINKK
ncbi:hypothetical protein HYS72_03640 [Candidatus Pacearchaeota archaeon]|nr:hypothetical protein [Candidatus Pacearchaeota archaeon]MBI2057263.1 hypothetical protein [Candidatus Pacearchaeota archaeon]